AAARQLDAVFQRCVAAEGHHADDDDGDDEHREDHADDDERAFHGALSHHKRRMPTLRFSVERNGPQRVEVTWSGNWNDFSATFDGQDIGSWTKDELTQGTKEVVLADGSKFKPHLRRVGLGPELALLRDGVPLPESAADRVQ